MKEFIKKNKQNSQMDEHDKRTYRGAFAMLSILAAIIIISSLSVVYSNQIKKQFFQERSKNLLNISSKVGDMMNSMITKGKESWVITHYRVCVCVCECVCVCVCVC